jgi:ATP-dependent RNA helicase DeaD
MSSPDVIRFADLALASPVLDAIAAVGYERPSPIQAESIPHLLNGHDLLGVAQTGTGKTAAFALPMLSRIDLSVKAPQVLVLAPTRELAIQVAEAFQSYATNMKGFHVLPIYGGQDMRGQLRQLQRGAQVVVGTPGRVMDHIRRGTLQLEALKSVVLDEADEMLRMGFIDDVEWILEHTPKQRQIALFSATMPKPIRKVADSYLKNPKEVRIESKTQTSSNIEQHYLIVNGFDRKLDAITRILEAQPFDAMIVFVRTKTATAELAEKLEARGYSAAALNGDMNQQLRERTIDRLKQGKIDIVIATDVAARGIDVERISHVLNFDIPYDSEAYVHRIGRTGRAGREGKAILFVAPREKRLLSMIERNTSQKIAPMQLPSGAEVTEKRIDNFKQLISDTLQNEELDFFYEVLEQYSIEAERSAEEIACALAFLLQRERPLQVKDAPRPKKERFEDDRDQKDKRPKREHKQQYDQPMERFRIEVGREHQVRPGDIVGAIVNEAGIDRDAIGYIKLNDDHSTVDLPADMPKEVFNALSKVRVRNQAMQLSNLGKAEGRPSRPPTKKPREHKSEHKGHNKPHSGTKKRNKRK